MARCGVSLKGDLGVRLLGPPEVEGAGALEVKAAEVPRDASQEEPALNTASLCPGIWILSRAGPRGYAKHRTYAVHRSNCALCAGNTPPA